MPSIALLLSQLGDQLNIIPAGCSLLSSTVRLCIENDQCKFIFVYFINVKLIIENVSNAYKIR